MSGRAVERRPRTSRPDRRDDERGSVALMVAVLTSLLIGVASFAIDLGMARVGVRDMQAIADVVALDMARHLDGRSRAEVLADPEWDESLAESIARNDGTFGVDGTLDVEAEPGVFNTVTRTVDTASTDAPDAVLVTATTAVEYIFRDGSNLLTRTAVGQASKTACFTLGSYAARFRSGDSVLLETLLAPMNAFVRPQANLDVLSYQGLANATVTLNELAATSDVGTVDELLTGTVTSGQLIRASITALQRQNPVNSVAVSALDQVLKGKANLGTPVLLTDVAAIAPSDSAAADTKLNVLDVVTGSILLADGEHFLDVPNLSANIGNLAPVSSDLRLVQKAQWACKDDVAQTSQLVGHMKLKMQLQSINGIDGIQGVVHTPEAIVDLAVNVGNGDARLAGPPTCGAGTSEDPDLVPVAVRSGLATLDLRTMLQFYGKIEIPVFDLLGVQIGTDEVEVTFEQLAASSVPMPDTTQDVTLQVPPNDNTPISVGSSGPLAPFTVASTATNITATIGGVTVTDPATMDLVELALAPVTSALAVDTDVTEPLNSLVGNVNNLLTPVRTLLGLQVSGVDVFAVGRPTCNGSNLRG